MITDGYNEARSISQTILRRSLDDSAPALTRSDIEAAVASAVRLLNCDIDTDRLVADLERSFETMIGAERLLTSEEDGYEPWLANRRASIDWAYWRRYEQFLREQGWAERTLLKLDETTDRVLGLLTAPDRPGAWDRRGMVVGHVQSGKTSHYTGLITKAADAGYRLIVVLAGFHKSLRSQTQVRLEEGFIGFDKSGVGAGGQIRAVGVGEIDATLRPGTVTTRADGGDFKRQVANQLGIAPGTKPLLLVVKKNGPVLKNLLDWLRSVANAKDQNGSPYLKDIPLLVIDDEADQGSIDTKDGAFDEDGRADEEHNPTVLNDRIRTLLRLFEQSAYVGYTATPFANIFIHERRRTKQQGEDLFPRSFIVSLPTPSNYVGPAQIFGYEGDNGNLLPGVPITRVVQDHAATIDPFERHGWMPPIHNKEHVPCIEGVAALPPSLRKAIRCFILSTAARVARGQERSHNSMLVHVTRFTNVQRHVVEQIQEDVADYRRNLRYDRDALCKELRDLWEADYVPTTREIAAKDCSPLHWHQIDKHLESVIESIQIREINGMAGEVLDYVTHRDQGLNVIAVGGDKLSRGLTLEGLTVSYFLRASRMYDTLMQMGRWFGYRPGYLDLCRLFSTPDLIEWFGHIATASEELRDDFNRMAASGGTPRDFGHRVRCHPSLMVTSRIKMRDGQEIQVTFAGDISETTSFWRDRANVQWNWDAGQKLIERIEDSGIHPTGNEWSGADADPILEFLSSYREHEASINPRLLAEYIRSELKSGRLTRWIVKVSSGEVKREKSFGSLKNVNLVNRDWYLGRGNMSPDEETRIRRGLEEQGRYRIRRLVSPADEETGLTKDQLKKALASTIESYESGTTRHKERPTRPTGQSLRAVRSSTEGLLLLYPLDGQRKLEKDVEDVPALGFAISFPYVDSEKASTVTYKVNNVYYEQELGRADDSEEVFG